MATQYTPTERAHTCQACTLANSMRICNQCQFYTPEENMKQIKFEEYETRMPAYALSYIVNNDDSGITAEDKTAIDEFMHQFDGPYIVDFGECEEYFTSRPAFGLPCNCIDVTILLQK